MSCSIALVTLVLSMIDIGEKSQGLEAIFDSVKNFTRGLVKTGRCPSLKDQASGVKLHNILLSGELWRQDALGLDGWPEGKAW